MLLGALDEALDLPGTSSLWLLRLRLAILRLLGVGRLLLLQLLFLVSSTTSHTSSEGAAHHMTHRTAYRHTTFEISINVCSVVSGQFYSPAVAAICLNMLGCWGRAIIGAGAAGGAAIGGFRAGAGAGRGGGADIRGGEAARPRRGIFLFSER